MKRKHQDLVVWQEAMRLVQVVYLATSSFPPEEVYAMTSQMRRAAISIPSNIAEGAGRGSQKEFRHFLTIARGSLCELETLLVLATDLGYLENNNGMLESTNKIFALLAGLIRSSKQKSAD